MPAAVAIPAIASVASSVIGAAASRKGSGASSTSGNNINQTQTPVEDPLWASFRNSLMPMMMQELNNAQQPVYGEAQKTGFMNELNDLAKASVSSLKNNLAATGSLRSGRAATGLASIEQDKLGKAAGFFSQLPFMEKEARFNRMGGLLGMATNWAGRAPVGMKTTGTSDGTNQYSQQGPGFWSQFGTDMAGQLALGKSGAFGWMFPKPKPTGVFGGGGDFTDIPSSGRPPMYEWMPGFGGGKL
jgi:hypothetical protein